MDPLSPSQRHRCMSHIHSKDTKPELIVRHYLFSRGYRYRKNCRRLPGTPDIVMRKYGVVIFIHGCFWHGHADSHLPKTNVDFWRFKIERNKARDAENKEKLKQMGWSVMTVWECQLKPAVRERTLKEIEYWINKCYIELMQPAKRYPVFHEDKGVRMVAEEIVKRK
jgi:DNA mismatch endonuclease (patch repair protein)